MGGFFGDFARTAGGAGNEVANATFANRDMATQAAADKLKLVQAGLQNQEIQARLKLLSQPPTGPNKDKLRDQLVVYANVPTATPKEKKVYQALIDSLDRGDSTDSVAQNLTKYQMGKEENAPDKNDDVIKQYSNALATGDTAEATRLQPLVKQFLDNTAKPTTPKTPTEYDQRLTDYLSARKLPDTPENRDKADFALKARERALPASGSTTRQDIDDTVQAILHGEATPILSNYSFRDRTAIEAGLRRAGFNQAMAEQDYKAVQRHLSTLNGNQQLRLQQAIEFANDTVPQIEQAYNRLATLAPRSGFRILNKGAMAAMKQLPGEAGSAAQQLDSLLADFTSELGTVYKGGNSSTDNSLALAAKNLDGDWNDKTFRDALSRIKQSIGIRKNSINAVKTAGVDDDTPYAPKTDVPTGAPPPGSKIRDYSDF